MFLKKGKLRFRLSSSSSDVSQQDTSRAEEPGTKHPFSKFLDEVTASVLHPIGQSKTNKKYDGKAKEGLQYSAKSLDDVHRMRNSTKWKEAAPCRGYYETDTGDRRMDYARQPMSMSQTKKLSNDSFFHGSLSSKSGSLCRIAGAYDDGDLPVYSHTFITEGPDMVSSSWIVLMSLYPMVDESKVRICS